MGNNNYALIESYISAYNTVVNLKLHIIREVVFYNKPSNFMWIKDFCIGQIIKCSATYTGKSQRKKYYA